MLVDASHLWNVVYPDKRPGAAGFRWSGNPPLHPDVELSLECAAKPCHSKCSPRERRSPAREVAGAHSRRASALIDEACRGAVLVLTHTAAHRPRAVTRQLHMFMRLLAKVLFAARGQLPLRSMTFFEDVSRRGVLRADGPGHRFAHYLLQENLARPWGGR